MYLYHAFRFWFTGGHVKYVEQREKAVETYKQLQDLGPMNDTVLHEYLASREDTEQAIISADQVRHITMTFAE